MYELNYTTTFAAAHQLKTAYSSECNENLHGHNFKVNIRIKTNELVNEMVVDFKRLKEVVNQLDHKNLNNIFTKEQPTTENIARYLFNTITDMLQSIKHIDNKNTYKIIVKVWEGEKASITYTA